MDFQPYYFGGAFAGGLVWIYLFSILFRYALLSNSGSKFQQAVVVLLTGVATIGLYGFGAGTGDFVSRITNLGNLAQVFAYSLATLLIAVFVWWRTDDTLPPTQTQGKRGIVGRAIALVFVIPMILAGLGNISGSVYSLAVNGPSPAPGLGVSRAEFRDSMLTGDLAPFWRMMSQRAPKDMDYIIEQVHAQQGEIKNLEHGIRIYNRELSNYRASLVKFAPLLNDGQRKNILQDHIDLMRAFENRPALCADVIMTGGQNMTQEQLLPARDLLNRASITIFGSLLDAREAAASDKSALTPPTEQDYGALRKLLYERGVLEDQFQALIGEDLSHPQFCQANIAFLDAAINLDGPSGEVIRFEMTNSMIGETR